MTADQLGYITNVKCNDCGKSFPIFTFTADVDMVTSSYIAVTDVRTKDIAIVRYAPGEPPASAAERTGPDYRFSSVLTSPYRNAAGLSFQEFLSRPAEAVTYSCIYCGGSAPATGEESVSEFEVHNRILVQP